LPSSAQPIAHPIVVDKQANVAEREGIAGEASASTVATP
jgi:hypothetical protein